METIGPLPKASSQMYQLMSKKEGNFNRRSQREITEEEEEEKRRSEAKRWKEKEVEETKPRQRRGVRNKSQKKLRTKQQTKETIRGRNLSEDFNLKDSSPEK